MFGITLEDTLSHVFDFVVFWVFRTLNHFVEGPGAPEPEVPAKVGLSVWIL